MQDLPTRLFTVGLICLFGTITIFWVVVPGAKNWIVTKMIRFEQGNEIYEEFTNIKVELLFKVHIYNVTNADDVASGKSLPKLQELGPYVYEEKRTNIPVSLNTDEDKFSYQSTVIFKFRKDLSNGLDDEDMITMLNVPIVSIAHELKSWSSMIRGIAKMYINSYQEPLFVQRKVRTALFDGVHSELIESISDILSVEYLPNNTFGYFYEKNATISPQFDIYAGVQDNSKFGKIISFKGKEKLDIWPGESCNMINGSDTTIYPPSVTKDTILRGFEMDICRSVYLEFEKEDQVNGIKGYRFGFPQDFFNGHNNSYNQCFLQEDEKSFPNGILSIGACRHNAPLMISHPHFLYADPYYNEITGLSPGDPNIHPTYAIIEPNTGIVLEGARRMQLNIQLKPSKDIPELLNVKETIVPLFWVDDAAAHPPSRIEDLKWRLAMPLKLVEIGKWFMLAISSFLIIVGVTIFMMRTKNKKPVQYSIVYM